MKRGILAILLVMTLALCISGCGKKSGSDASADKSTGGTASAGDTTSAGEEESQMEFGNEGEYVVFNADLSFALESDAWLGVIPTGTIYEKEIDADDVDIIYTYCENLDDEGIEKYRFAFDKDYFYSIEDGTYDLVLCSSDDGEVGKVLFQCGLEKKGNKFELDYKNNK